MKDAGHYLQWRELFSKLDYVWLLPRGRRDPGDWFCIGHGLDRFEKLDWLSGPLTLASEIHSPPPPLLLPDIHKTLELELISVSISRTFYPRRLVHKLRRGNRRRRIRGASGTAKTTLSDSCPLYAEVFTSAVHSGYEFHSFISPTGRYTGFELIVRGVGPFPSWFSPLWL